MMNKDRQERTRKLSTSRKTLTALTVLVIMPLCYLLLASVFNDKGEEKDLMVVMATSTSTVPFKVSTVEYQIEVTSNEPSLLVEFWYTSESGGKNQADSIRVNNSRLFTRTVMISSGEQIELAGVLMNAGTGELTCRILVDDTLIEQSTSQGAGAGVYCSGGAFSQK